VIVGLFKAIKVDQFTKWIDRHWFQWFT